MKKKILSEKSLYFGNIQMPTGFEIDQEKLTLDIDLSKISKKEFPFSKTWDMLQTYLRDHILVDYNFTLIPKKTFGKIFKSDEISIFNLEIDIMDLKNSPDYVMIYGVNITKNSCEIVIEYDDNRRKDKKWKTFLNNNNFIMFPSTLRYSIKNYETENLNYLLITTYDYI
jgi:hypothetical protein